MGCILSKFYIKPQRPVIYCRVYCVVSYRNSTSNHNKFPGFLYSPPVVSYRNSTSNHNWLLHRDRTILVVSYRNSTSNHNIFIPYLCWKSLYLIEILHQTTTCMAALEVVVVLYLIEILHQTTTKCLPPDPFGCCILSKFYIKPQLTICNNALSNVVSYRNSTSNHNFAVDQHVE